MIFLKRYKKYCVKPDKYTNIAVHGILCMYDYHPCVTKSPSKYIFGSYRNHGYTTTINTRFTLDKVSIDYIIRKKVIHRINIADSYSLDDGYVREITTIIYIKGKPANTATLTRTFVCSAELTSIRKAYYDLLKGHFLCRIFN